MPPKVGLTAAELQAQYGDVLSAPPLSEAGSPFLLHSALTQRQPPIAVSHAAVKVWWGKYKVAPGAEAVQSAQDLEDRHGAGIKHLVAEHPTAYKLCKALRERDPPLFVSDGIAKEWLRKFGGHGDLVYIDSAGHLETRYGERIRADVPQEQLQVESLCKWLFKELSVSVPARVCQKWLTSDWSSSGELLYAQAVEEALGDRRSIA